LSSERADVKLHEKNRSSLLKYNITAWFYDILDLPWEKQYRKWRPQLVGDVRGKILEAGIGTGRNLEFYHPEVHLTGIDLCPVMIRRARQRSKEASCQVSIFQEDACVMESIPSDHYDWIVATFLCCVVPEELQKLVLDQFARVLKPGGRFRLLEMVYSRKPHLRKRQDFFAPFVEKVYGARFDRKTLDHAHGSSHLKVTETRYLKHDIYLLIDGTKEIL
jgi:ubiquinone/menaquinone biosynthesis C-methylase UbiE